MKTKIFFLALLFPMIGYSQNFKEIGNDIKGDQITSTSVDLKSISVATDFTQDSIWIMLTTHDSLINDWGFSVLFDTNEVATDGKNWKSTNKASNNDLNYELKLDLLNNRYFPPTDVVLSDGLGKYMREIELSRPDSFSVIIRFQLSALDQNGKFNLLCGGGSFDGFLYDNMPNSSYISYDATSITSVKSYKSKESTLIYPNPTDGIIQVKSELAEKFKIYTSNGSLVLKGILNPFDKSIDISILNNGAYIIEILNSNNTNSKQLILKK